MSETSEKNTSELDEYGVWVKSPQHEESKTSEDAAVKEDTGNDLPDLSFLDDIAGIENVNETSKDATLDEEISLDEFITDGFSEPENNETPAPAEKASEPETESVSEDTQSSASDGEVSLDEFISADEFGFSDDAPAKESSGPSSSDGEISLDEFMDADFTPPKEENEPEEEEEDPLDIDLDFDESSKDIVAGEEQEDIASMDYDVISEPPVTENTDTSENVTDDFLSDFDTSGLDSTPSGDEKSDSGSESIDLSEFGFEDDSDNQNPVIDTGDAGKEKVQGPVDYEMNVESEEDDAPEAATVQEESSDSDEISIDISPDEPIGSEAVVDQSKDFNAPDDDFDLDSIMNNIEDESGNSVSFSETSEESAPVAETTDVTDNAAESSVTEESAVTEESSEDINFDDMPVFEDKTYDEDQEVPSSEETVTETNIEETNVNEAENDSSVTEDFIFETDSDTPESTADESLDFTEEVTEEPSEESKVEDSTDETAEETSGDISIPSISEDTIDSISLDDFMGEEGFTDGGPGVTGEYPAEDNTEEETSDEDIQAAEENTDSSEITVDESTTEALDDFTFETDDSPSEETTEEEPDFTETDEPQITEEIDLTEKSEASEDSNESEETVFEEIDLTKNTADTDSDSDNEQKTADATAMIADIMNQNITKRDTSEIELENPETEENDAIEGVTLTMDDFAKLDEKPVVTPENTPIDGYGADASKYMDIPDSFDEEAASLNSDFAEEEPVSFKEEKWSVFEPKTEENQELYEVQHSENMESTANMTEETKTTESASESALNSNDILLKISGELAALRSEISTLKNQFEDLKNNENAESKAIAGENTEEDSIDLPVPSADDNISEGFFSDNDSDDTIALSGDELNNILNTAEFTQHEEVVLNENPDSEEISETAPESSEEDEDVYVENTDNDLTIDFNNETLEEPVFDDQTFETDESEETDDDEISVPKVDDILVESSSDDLMEKGVNADVGDTDQNDLTLDDTAVPDTTLESLSKPIDLFNDDSDTADEVKEDDSEEETIEEGISESPVQDVFNNWNSKSEEEPEIADASTQMDMEENNDEVTVQEPAAETETSVTPAPAPAPSSSSNDIPENMKQEIKSVLSYMDQLLENLPEDKIAEFAQSEQFETYKKLFNELGLA